MIKASVIALLLGTIFTVNAQKAQWQLIQEKTPSQKEQQARVIVPNDYKVFSIDFDSAVSKLKASSNVKNKSRALFNMPMPDGSIQTFRVVETPVFEKELQEKYPNIRSYTGYLVNNPSVVAKFGYSQKGLHAMIMTPGESRVFIDPYSTDTNSEYVSYYKKDYDRQHEFSCSAEAHNVNPDQQLSQRAGDCQLRTYRLALACTGEYATYHGGTVESVLAEYNIAMTRVNGIYETDLGITMVLINETDQVIFLNGQTDPYTNNSGSAMLGQNQTTLDDIIGNDNYDIGHVFSTGGGGIASLRSPCNSGQKARGVTGLGAPVNDPFYVDYVCHEIGHQFGANHTQNNSCNRNNATAMEVGSANTIMGYAGICAPNSQGFSDDHFHAVSIAEIAAYIVDGNGGTCGITSTTDNNAPTINLAQSQYNLPIATPFALTAIAEDPDGDALTYCWEQYDNEVASMPPLTTNTEGPAFISKSPELNPTRYFPSLNNILTNSTPQWEVIPFVSREMNFRCTVRDNNGLVGCTAEDDLVLNFHSEAGPFLVESPNTNVTWNATDIVTVTWDVAGTDQSPIDCANVDILISTDGGLTYEYVAAENVTNNGSYELTVPDIQTDMARVMIKCSDNVFFDISDENFSITTPFTVALSPSDIIVCEGDDFMLDINSQAFSGFSGMLDLSVTGLPGTTTSSFGNNPLTITETTTLNLSNINGGPGVYTAVLTAEGPSITISKSFNITIQPSDFSGFNLMSPNDGQQGIAANGSLDWEAVNGINTYNIEIATDILFSNIVFTADNVSNTNVNYADLLSNTVYYWRAKANSICTDDSYSQVFAFQTGGEQCTSYLPGDLPIEISSESASINSSIINVSDLGSYESMKCFVGIDHEWTGDLKVDLISPNGTNIALVDQIGVPADMFGCQEDNMYVLFDDQAPNTAADLEAACGDLADSYQAITPLNSILEEDPNGSWTLSVEDLFQSDGGAITSAYLEFCNTVSIESLDLNQNILFVNKNLSRTISSEFLNAPNSEENNTFYTLLTLPAHGQLQVDNLLDGNYTDLSIGSFFTQADINNGKIQYLHNGNDETTDLFRFDVLDNSFGWIHNQAFEITINQEAFAGTALVAMNALCFGEASGSIYAEVLGGIGPYKYSLDGTTFQSDNEFSNLAAGDYTITIKDATGIVISTNVVTIAQAEIITISTSLNAYNLVVNAAGGSGSYNYSIDGINYQESNIFPNLVNGDYTIYITDTNNCIAEEDYTINIPALNFETINVSDVLCNQGATGALEIIANGGVSPYQYSIDGINYSAENNFDGLIAGDYALYVRDAGGMVFTSMATVGEPDPITATSEIRDNIVIINPIGGTAPFSYSLDASNYSESNEIAVSANGNYTVYIRDANNCLAIITVTVNTFAVTATASTVDLACNNVADGTITIDAINGEAPYEYSLNDIDYQSSNVFTGLSAGTFEVFVKDANGVIFNIPSIVINEPNAVQASATSFGLEITILANGGTGDLMYSIDGGISFSNSNVFTTPVGGGTYNVVVVDANGCTDENDIVVLISSLSDLAATFGASLYPNPVMDIVTLQFDESQDEALNIQILDNTGSLITVLNTKSINNTIKVDMSALESGIYHIVVTNGDKRASSRIIKI